MKVICVLIVFCGVLFVASILYASNWNLAWMNFFQLFEPNGHTPLHPYSLVQLVADGGKDGVDDPYEWWMSQPDPNAAMQLWLANGCPPVGDDYLVISKDPWGQNPTYVIDFSDDPEYTPEIYDGWFGVFYVVNSTPAFGSGVGLYTRFYTSQNPENGDFYGTVGAEEMGQPFMMYQLDNDVFPTYMVQGGIANQQIVVPEPGSIGFFSIGVIAASFLKRKKQ